MITPPDYAAAEKQARLVNAEKMRANLNAVDIERKIRNWADRYSLEPEFVKYKVLTDDTFALQFVKDPAKQGIHQKVAAQHIETAIPFVQEFKMLPAGGPMAEYVLRGGHVMLGRDLHQTTNDHCKSIDFKWHYARSNRMLRVYATHKHTKEEGGSQDNQYADVKRFLSEVQTCRDPNILFLAICDGDYYLQPNDGRSSRLQVLQEDLVRMRSRACTIASLPSLLAVCIQEWLAYHGMVAAPEEFEFIHKLTNGK